MRNAGLVRVGMLSLTSSGLLAGSVGAQMVRPPSGKARVTSVSQATRTLPGFWTTFRKAALAKDAAGIAALSASPVTQRGELDDSPVKRLMPGQVPPVLARLLDQPDGVDAAGRSQRAMLAATPVPRRDPQMPADRFRFGDMEFARGAAGWRLTQIYYEADD